MWTIFLGRMVLNNFDICTPSHTCENPVYAGVIWQWDWAVRGQSGSGREKWECERNVGWQWDRRVGVEEDSVTLLSHCPLQFSTDSHMSLPLKKGDGRREEWEYNPENNLFNSSITFHIVNKYIKLIYRFGLWRYMLRQDIVAILCNISEDMVGI